MDEILRQWQERVQQASSQGTALCLRGAGSKDWYGQDVLGEILDTRAWRGIVAYEPSELVITARCGTPLAEIEQVLAAQQQILAFEPPHFTNDATLGGMFSAGLAGPRRASCGALRDFVLGASLLDGRGEILHFGGQVMKNVAGYDVSRLLAGALGTLGIVLQVSLKVMPKPQAEQSLRFEMHAHDALHNLQRWQGQGMPLLSSAWCDGQLTLRLAGSEVAVAAARKHLGGASLAHGAGFWQSLREQRLAYFAQRGDSERSLWRLSLPANAPLLDLPGPQLIEWHGAQRWLQVEANVDEIAQAQQIRQIAHSVGGHACLFRGGDKSVGVFAPLSKVLTQIHLKLKQSFDPAGIFNRGRMYREW